MKKFVKALAAITLAAGLVGCSSGSSAATSNGNSKSSGDDKTITVGATAVPHAEILNDAVAPVLKKEGYTLKVTVFNDYVQPNTAVEDGELDANYYQTLGYLNDQNKQRKLHLVAVAGVHIEPMGIYSKKIKDIKDLKDGAEISLPNDSDNEDRALQFLVAQGLLNDPKKDGNLTDADFNGNATTNPHNYKISPVEAAQVALTLDDVDAGVVNGNYALEAKLPETNPALVTEKFDDDTTIARTNFIVVKEDNKDSAKTKALVKAVNSDEVKKYIDDTYKGSVIASFVDPDSIDTSKY